MGSKDRDSYRIIVSAWTKAQLRSRAQALSLAETLGDISHADERDAILDELASR